ncbi:MAG: flavodoxin family protein [Zoogloeaceae bacterium]|nr:flavodoxin family protein [Zoogloeaceae bacterium]
MSPYPRLLVAYHTQSGNTERLAKAVLTGAQAVPEVDVVLQRAFDTGITDLAQCRGILLGTPENFGTMSGALKDLFDRTYYPLEGKMEGVPFAIFVSAGNDGSGAVREIRRIANGYRWKEVAEPVIARGELTEADLARCRDLGEAFASGLAMGIF